ATTGGLVYTTNTMWGATFLNPKPPQGNGQTLRVETQPEGDLVPDLINVTPTGMEFARKGPKGKKKAAKPMIMRPRHGDSFKAGELMEATGTADPAEEPFVVAFATCTIGQRQLTLVFGGTTTRTKGNWATRFADLPEGTDLMLTVRYLNARG